MGGVASTYLGGTHATVGRVWCTERLRIVALDDVASVLLGPGVGPGSSALALLPPELRYFHRRVVLGHASGCSVGRPRVCSTAARRRVILRRDARRVILEIEVRCSDEGAPAPYEMLLFPTADRADAKSLVSRMLPEFVAGELTKSQRGWARRAEVFEMRFDTWAAVLMADVCGSTEFARANSPSAVCDMYTALYGAFDRIIVAYAGDVYKVETAGDAYMVMSAGGCSPGDGAAPGIQRNIACDVMCKIAQHMLRAATRVFGAHAAHRRLAVRIGVHCGPVTAAVHEAEMVRFHVFGLVPAVAARLEANAHPGTMLVSEDVLDMLDAPDLASADPFTRGDSLSSLGSAPTPSTATPTGDLGASMWDAEEGPRSASGGRRRTFEITPKGLDTIRVAFLNFAEDGHSGDSAPSGGASPHGASPHGVSSGPLEWGSRHAPSGAFDTRTLGSLLAAGDTKSRALHRLGSFAGRLPTLSPAESSALNRPPTLEADAALEGKARPVLAKTRQLRVEI
jgi:class 3 adenylate cyclase